MVKLKKLAGLKFTKLLIFFVSNALISCKTKSICYDGL